MQPQHTLPSTGVTSEVSPQVVVLGLGYVGLPLLLSVARVRPVVGVDVDADRVALLRGGQSYLRHIDPRDVENALRARRLRVEERIFPSSEVSAYVVCVPTRVFADGTPDLSCVEDAARAVGAVLRRGQLVVVESSVHPGTTEHVIAPLLERVSGLRAGVDFHLACSPERTSPGDDGWRGPISPKLVAGLTQACTRRAMELYAPFVDDVVPVSRPMIAELAKVHENTFRAVNVALVNELKSVCQAAGVDVHEVLDAAASKPFGYLPFAPGPGVGGRCVPLMARYFTQLAREHGVAAPVVESALAVNDGMPARVVMNVERALLRRGIELHGARITAIGLSYKRGVGDAAESPALAVLDGLRANGAVVAVHDPLVPAAGAYVSRPLTRELLAESDAVLVLTDHDGIDWDRVLAHAPVVLDSRRLPGGRDVHPRVVKV